MSNFIPNSFMVPNAIVDEALAKLSGNACKIYLLIVRKTRGWNKPADFISFSQIRKFTGISSNETINKAMDELVNYRLVKVKNGNQKTSNEYYINDFGITENVKFLSRLCGGEAISTWSNSSSHFLSRLCGGEAEFCSLTGSVFFLSRLCGGEV